MISRKKTAPADWAMQMDARGPVEDLVQGRLGCGCPAEVFDHLERRLVTDVYLPDVLELTIGRRLLVHLVDAAAADREIAAALLERGRRWRDERGLNRFRLVLVGGREEDYPPPPDLDDRLHWHCLSDSDF
ncbi:MAG: hypothetical protein KJ621_14235 [Proteobacteria bacterium]|nr:hypothetical protein [Pseudomonadota bacterium]MBU1742882.1 hypothetical protein [Pseudomonadota bacterium]